VEDTSLKTSHS